MSSTDPAVLSDGQLLQFCASVLEVHAESIFVYAKDGRRLISELRKRAGDAPAPTKEDIEDLQVVASDGEVIFKVSDVRHRSQERPDKDWLPTPIPGRTNIRLSVIDETGGVADMELGNAASGLAERVTSLLIEQHAEGLRRREGERS